MAEYDTYDGVDMDEEDQKKKSYPPPVAPTPTAATAPLPSTVPAPAAAGTPAPMPAMAAPPQMPQTQYPAPSIGPTVSASPPPPPEWKNYAPPERHGLAKFGSALAALNPATNSYFNVRPEQRAEKAYGTATNEYKEQLGAGEAARKETSEGELKASEAERNKAQAEALKQGTGLTQITDSKGITHNIPIKDFEKFIQEQERQAGAGQRTAETVAGAGAREAGREKTQEDIAKEVTDRDKAVARIRATQQPLVVVSTPEGPRYTPRNQAAGQTPGRVLSPQDHLKISQNMGQLNLAIPRAQYLHDHADMISTLIDSGKIALGIGADGTLEASIGKGMTLTPEESTFAANFQNMTEDINLLRAPLGATGFRSREAFEALQAQRGRLAQNPDVFKKVLEGTLASMQNLQQTNKDALTQNQPAQGGGDQGGGNASAAKPKGQWNAKTGRYE